MKNPKVTMFGWEFPPYKIGGLATHCFGITKALSEKGVEVNFLLPYGEPDAYKFLNIIPTNKTIPRGKKPKKDPYYTPKKKNIPITFEDFFKSVEEFSKKAPKEAAKIDCDLIHCQDWMTVLAGLKAKELLKKPMVITMHSTEFDRTGQLCPGRFVSQIESKGMKAADRIITVSEFTKQDIIKKFKIPAEKIRVVHNAFNPEDIAIKKPKKFGLDEKVVLFLGRLTVQKGTEFFLEAAKKIISVRDDVRFIVVGFGDLYEHLIEKAIDLEIYGKVLFTGFKSDVDNYYRMADVYVMPSVSEPFGITALEAVACGIPTIVTNQSGAAEVLPHALKYDFWDVDELANKILCVLDYAPMRKEMLDNSAKEIPNINWINAADKTIKIYNELIA